MSGHHMPPNHRTILGVWKSGQTGLATVPRWAPFQLLQGTRPQSTLQHSYALTVLTMIFLEHLRPHTNLDELLLMYAVMVHDHGEGELGRDVLIPDKSHEKDLEEYQAFVKRYKDLRNFKVFHDAFLLQFCLSPPPIFPKRARAAMARMAVRHRSTALAFRGLELFDYVLYAAEQFDTLGNRDILAHVLGNTHEHLDRVARELPGFGDVFWTRSFAEWCRTTASGGNPALPKQ